MRTARALEVALSFAVALTSSAMAESLSSGRVVGSCPDASTEEAQAMGFRQVPLKMPEFVRRGEFSATAVEARIEVHSAVTFGRIDEAFGTFLKQLPTIENKVAPNSDKDLFGEFTDDESANGSDPFFAFCFSYDAENWSFAPGAEVEGLRNQLLLDGRSALIIPAQTYAVFEYDGPRADTANFRYSLTSRFWPLSSVRRISSPNFEVYPQGDDGASANVRFQLWVAVDPSTIPESVLVSDY